ncbi:2'-deoxycytidine 5'-triphosphate deaminase [Candidatus Parcubacteria bacterium]|nr:2'-deoxycytidine 5'-triphosphate deaminase [Candidatus Parcubacteria bacterium]
MTEKKIGALPAQYIRKMFSEGEILNSDEKNIQPASIDLSVSEEGYRMKGTFLPKKSESIRDIIKSESIYKIDLNNPLEKNGVYLIRLNEKLNLSKGKFAFTSSKSSIGRIDLQTRLVVDGYSRFDGVPCGYKGELWLQIIPKSFLIKLNAGDKLNQIRFFNGEAKIGSADIREVYEKYKLIFDKSQNFIPVEEELTRNNRNNIVMTIELSGQDDNQIVGYKNLLVDQVVDLSKINYYDADEFFEPIISPKNGKLVLEKDSFYIFYTKEFIRIPKEFSSEMIAYDISNGEFRSHYAGFFDPGFGYGQDGEIKGRQAVLEVRSYDSNFVFRDGQPICQMSFENLIEPAEFVYGQKIGSNYVNQDGPKLSKYFKSEIK